MKKVRFKRDTNYQITNKIRLEEEGGQLALVDGSLVFFSHNYCDFFDINSLERKSFEKILASGTSPFGDYRTNSQRQATPSDELNEGDYIQDIISLPKARLAFCG